MRIIPAIDIIDGKCVRLTQGNYDQKTEYNKNPLEVAKEFEDNGIKYLHLVDLDGARTGKIVNQAILLEICNKTNLIVDFGGGLKTTEDVQSAFDAGASQITAGSIAVKNPELVKDWIAKFGAERIILGADVKENAIAINGWKEKSQYSLTNFIEMYVSWGIKQTISTDISVDGTLNGPAIELYNKMKNDFPELKIIASGGVGKYEDLEALSEIGVDGVIIGKAIYEGKISLKELSNYVD